jgi:hypothetical protein
MEGMNAVYAQDEYGRPFIILREQQKKSRLSGIEAQKVHAPLTSLLFVSWTAFLDSFPAAAAWRRSVESLGDES